MKGKIIQLLKSRIARALFFILCVGLSAKIFAANDKPAGFQSDIPLPNLVYYDADNITGNKTEGYLKLEGNATLLLGDIYLNARKIIVLKFENIVTAEGDVKLIYDKEKAVASKIVFDLSTKQVRMDNALVFSDPLATEGEVSKEALGLTKAEIAFDAAKATRAKEIEQQLKSLRIEFSNLKNLKDIKHNDATVDEKINAIVSRYGQLLARYSRTQYQPNVYLSELPPREKEKLMLRRQAVQKFNQDNPAITSQISNFKALPGYVNVSASQILQKDNHTFLLNNAIITPCQCSPHGEPPLFGFSTQNAQIDVGNYITMQGTTFDALSVPIFYTPWFKISIKNKRETGFLAPSGYASNNAGQAITVPFFLVLGDHADSTLTYQNFSGRGHQLQTEVRAQFFDGEEFQSASGQSLRDNGFYSLTQFIPDKKYSNDWNINSNNIAHAIEQNPSSQSLYDNFRGNNLSNRWYNQESLNIPISYWGSVKTNGQFVSDNSFLSDFAASTLVSPTSTVKGDTTPASRRFLAQEVDTEYYGDNSVVSVRAQGQQDLFAQSKSDTPVRVPRLEYNLLPKRYLNTPFVLSNNTTWENVEKPGGLAYIPTPASAGAALTPEQKGPNDPFAQGNRLFSTSTLALPLPYNDYVNASASAQATGTQYSFPAVGQNAASKPYEGYMHYNATASVPVFARMDLKALNQSESASITQTITPTISLDYIPNVVRSNDFPHTYSLWYAGDNVARSAYLTVGVTSSWTIRKQNFKKNQVLVDRFLQTPEPSVGNLDNFSAVVKDKKLAVETKPESIFQFSSEGEANQVFKSWAQKELDSYHRLVLVEELNQNYEWPHEGSYALNDDLNITPLSVGISTNYNFMAEQTAQELNSIAGPNFISPYLPSSYGDINTSLNWNLDPFATVNGNISAAYSQLYKRFSSGSATFNTTLPYNVSLSFSHALQYVVSTAAPTPGSATPTTSTDFVEKTQDAASLGYAPLTWLNLGFQWSLSTDPTALATDTSEGRAYASSYYINIANIQNCLDLTIQRNKAAGSPERLATYLIGINLKIFGIAAGPPQDVGNYINRKLQQ